VVEPVDPLQGGALGVGMSHSATQSILASLLTGALACWAVVVVQAALAERHGAQRTTALTEANLGGSLGSILGASFLATFAASHVSWRLALAPPVLTVVVLLVTSYREPIGRTLDPVVHSGRSAMPRRFWAFWTTLLLGVGIEWSITFWAVSYLQDALYLSKAAATTAAGGMFAAMTKATYTKPDQVATYVRCATHSWFGRCAEKSRSTESAGRGAAASGVVVRRVLPRRTPSRPSSPSSRSTVQRATAIPRGAAAARPYRCRRRRTARRGRERSRL
jgi:MFS family permease